MAGDLPQTAGRFTGKPRLSFTFCGYGLERRQFEKRRLVGDVAATPVQAPGLSETYTTYKIFQPAGGGAIVSTLA